jgi:hypothetical protein
MAAKLIGLRIVYTFQWDFEMERTPCKLRLLKPNYKEAAPWLEYPKAVPLSTPGSGLRRQY